MTGRGPGETVRTGGAGLLAGLSRPARPSKPSVLAWAGAGLVLGVGALALSVVGLLELGEAGHGGARQRDGDAVGVESTT